MKRPHKIYARSIEYGTTTGRRTTNFPPFKEFPSMTSIDCNPENIEDPATRRLSEFIFSLYHPNPAEHRHSNVSDKIAKNLAEESDKMMELATLMARCHGLPDDIEVSAFASRRRDSDISSLDEALLKLLIGDDEVPLHERELVNDNGDVNHVVLWAKAHQKLGGDDSEVIFDPAYAECKKTKGCRHPGIHGPGVDMFTVAGAMMAVVVEEGAMLTADILRALPDTQDEEGWVYLKYA